MNISRYCLLQISLSMFFLIPSLSQANADANVNSAENLSTSFTAKAKKFSPLPAT
jgi:hypothetical protein